MISAHNASAFKISRVTISNSPGWPVISVGLNSRLRVELGTRRPSIPMQTAPLSEDGAANYRMEDRHGIPGSGEFGRRRWPDTVRGNQIAQRARRQLGRETPTPRSVGSRRQQGKAWSSGPATQKFRPVTTAMQMPVAVTPVPVSVADHAAVAKVMMVMMAMPPMDLLNRTIHIHRICKTAWSCHRGN